MKENKPYILILKALTSTLNTTAVLYFSTRTSAPAPVVYIISKAIKYRLDHYSGITYPPLLQASKQVSLLLIINQQECSDVIRPEKVWQRRTVRRLYAA